MRSAALLFLFAQVAYSFILPIKLAAVVNQTEQAEVLSQNNNYWTTTVIIGTPGTAFTVAIDTTSSLLFVPDVSSGYSNKNATFDGSKSSTYNSTVEWFSLYTVFGATTGKVGQDTVILGETFSNDPKRTSITVPNATFGQVTMVPHNMPAGIDGVLGLAFSSLSPAGTLPVFQQANNQRNILVLCLSLFAEDVAAGIFVLWLEDQWATSDNGTHGVIYYGNYDKLHCKTDQRHVYPLSSASLFQFTMSSFAMSSPSGNFTYFVKSQTVIDSTSQYIAAPPQLVGNILSQLGLNMNTALPATVPCNTKIDLAFTFPLGTEHINELNLIFQLPDGTCKLALIKSYPIGLATPAFELGIPFLRGRCTYFDVGNQKIGFSDPITHGSEH